MPKKNIKRIISNDQKHKDAMAEDIKTGEESISGSEADLESDDDALEAAHKQGLYENQDEEHPGELGVDKETYKDELEHQEKD